MGLIDETRDHEEGPINEIVLPLLNVSRRLPDGEVNPKEPNQQRLFMTSSTVKTSFAYNLLLDVYINSIINPNSYFCMGCDYRVPMLHGLLDKTYINELKTSPSYSEESFAREYLSLWMGSSSESWFKIDNLQKYRILKNPETHKKNVVGVETYYLISVDVGRINDQTVASIFKVHVDKAKKHHAKLVNLFVLARQNETKTFTQQAMDIKLLVKAFQPREVVIDTNGLGVGLADEMIKTQYTLEGEALLPLGFKNDELYYSIQPKDAPKILYGIKANGPLNSRIHSNCFARLSGGLVHFLIKEQEAKNTLMSTKIGSQMSPEDRIRRLMPHEMTSKLFDEMANLRLKQTGNANEIALEKINSRYPKDKYSSFSYGLWRIKELEEADLAKTRRRFGNGDGSRQLVFFD